MPERHRDWLRQARLDLDHARLAAREGDVVDRAKALDKHDIPSRYPNGFDQGIPNFPRPLSFHRPGRVASGSPEARHKLDLGHLDAAQARCETDLSYASSANRIRCHAILGRIALRRDITAARSHLATLRDWTARTGDVEIVLEAHLIAAEIARLSGDLQGALTEARTGLNLADGCGFGLLAIEVLVLLGRASLAIPDHRAALQHAREALDRSQRDGCGYAWGEADALHLCGLAHRGLGEIDLAARRLEAAVILRERIEHPGLEESRQALADLPPRL